MTSRVIPVAPFTLVVFGATGDLSRRKILPALMHRDLAGQLPQEARIIGVSRREMARAAFQGFARDAWPNSSRRLALGDGDLPRFVERLDYVAADATTPGGWDELKAKLAERPDDIKVFYLATSPDLFGPIAEKVGAHGHGRRQHARRAGEADRQEFRLGPGRQRRRSAASSPRQRSTASTIISARRRSRT